MVRFIRAPNLSVKSCERVRNFVLFVGASASMQTGVPTQMRVLVTTPNIARPTRRRLCSAMMRPHLLSGEQQRQLSDRLKCMIVIRGQAASATRRPLHGVSGRLGGRFRDTRVPSHVCQIIQNKPPLALPVHSLAHSHTVGWFYSFIWVGSLQDLFPE